MRVFISLAVHFIWSQLLIAKAPIFLKLHGIIQVLCQHFFDWSKVNRSISQFCINYFLRAHLLIQKTDSWDFHFVFCWRCWLGEFFGLVVICSKWLIMKPIFTLCCYTHLGQGKDASDHVRSKYTLLRDVEDSQVGLYDKPLPCFGCGIGWFSWVPSQFLVYNTFWGHPVLSSLI